ncbi:uncharacterized protein BX664DRAFT_333283 [Halteromyces radiatus]|uniref:uncharacterized protein n=1 Tax=Halteromyces radiatus TaxID=101107 RepID=UPI0022210B92|nr:uncharacterized protein BX664DRAFT_333283 [Halteromyces radiatus]KAI8089542.1 hypothetical protein BX664DRAFT_333283 [Halteromyces radiatus]
MTHEQSKMSLEKDNDSPEQQTVSEPIDLLGSTMQDVQTSFSSVYSTLQRTLEQNVQMTQTMNRVIHHLFQTNIKIGTRLEYDQGTTRLTITVHNATAFPVIGLSAKLDFKPIIHSLHKSDLDRSSIIPQTPLLKLISSSHHMTTTDGHSNQSVSSLFLTSSSSTSIPPLLSNMKHVEIITINTSQPTQYNGIIEIQVPVPGSTESVHLNHSFGLYLVDQLKKIVLPSHLYQQQVDVKGENRTYHGQFLRDTFALDPVLGLEKGMLICLEPSSSASSSDDKIMCRIESISLDPCHIQVRIFGENKCLVDNLVNELDSLNKIVC